ncbi:MAG TPA: nucleotide exchange factor GrpE [Thermodesulfovibrionales bacterium]|nr:nucleotide exchange factor GrpE [Thermodesulfovibrionales bacterium]
MENGEVLEKKEGEIIESPAKEAREEKSEPEAELAELKDRYLRLYAEFENFKKRVQKDKEELIRYGNESLLHDILPVIDNLEMALKHSSDDVSDGLVKGVEITLRELQRVVEKYGLSPVPALGKPFDPSVHHAMTQVERADVDDKTVVEEFRKGYMLGAKVLRPSLVAVSKKNECESESKTNVDKSNKESKEA